MGTRFIAETRFRGEETVAAQLVKSKLISLGYRHKPSVRLEGGDPDNRFQRFERRANEDDDLPNETERLKNSGVWAGLRSLRLV